MIEDMRMRKFDLVAKKKDATRYGNLTLSKCFEVPVLNASSLALGW
jgi:hypothetical protein